MGLADGNVDDLEDGDGEGCGFTGSGLGLGDGVAPFADLDDGTGLDGGRRLVAIGVDSTEEVFYGLSVSQAAPRGGSWVGGAHP